MIARLRVARLVVLAVALATPALARDESSTCVAAFEDAQRFRSDQHLRAAREALVTCSRSVCPRVVADKCKKWRDGVESALPSIALSIVDDRGAAASGATIRIDGERVVVPDDGVITLDPGTHAVRVELAGTKPAEARFELAPGEKKRPVSLRLEREAPPPPPSASASTEAPTGGIPTASYVLGGVGVVALGAFAYLGLKGRSDEDTLSSTCSPACSPDDVSSVKSKYIAADVALGIGLVSLGVAAWLALDSSAHPSPAATAIDVGPRGVSFRARF